MGPAVVGPNPLAYVQAMAETSADASEPTVRRLSPKKVISFLVGLAIVVVIFAWAIPKFADYGDVWTAIQGLTPLEFWSLLAVTVFNLFTYWLANAAALPGLRLRRSAVVTQSSTSVANVLPAGGAFAIGMTYTILDSWGFTGTETALYVGVTGIWNIFIKLGLPVIALGLLVVTGHAYPALVGGAVIGIVVLAVAVTLLVLVFKSESLARKVGDLLGRAISWFRHLMRKPSVTGMGDRAVKFRRGTIVLVSRRWLRLTWTTVLSQVALCIVLIMSLRHMGVSEQELPSVEIFAVYSFSRLLSTIPITPGGVGVIDLGYIAGLTALYEGEHAQIVAGVLMFRFLTYGIQVPLGAFTYVIWRRAKSWRRDTPPPGSISADLVAARSGAEA
jgi:uncharacterized membrane protein YbhN (UPF0104 family)